MNFKKILFVLTLALLVVTMSFATFADEPEEQADPAAQVDVVEDGQGDDGVVAEVDNQDNAGDEPVADDNNEPAPQAADDSSDESSEEVTSVLDDGDTTVPEAVLFSADDTAADTGDAGAEQDLAATGMLQWPILVCAIAGGVLVVLGIVLVVASKKKKAR